LSFSEEIASLNLAKFRKVQTELGELISRKNSEDFHLIFCFAEESAERADIAENQLGKLRVKNRSSVSVGRSSEVVS
jgi:hypothetical protein